MSIIRVVGELSVRDTIYLSRWKQTTILARAHDRILIDRHLTEQREVLSVPWGTVKVRGGQLGKQRLYVSKTEKERRRRQRGKEQTLTATRHHRNHTTWCCVNSWYPTDMPVETGNGNTANCTLMSSPTSPLARMLRGRWTLKNFTAAVLLVAVDKTVPRGLFPLGLLASVRQLLKNDNVL